MIYLAISMAFLTLIPIFRSIVRDTNRLTIDDEILRVKQIVASEFGITVAMMLSKSRRRTIMDARQTCHWAMASKVVENRLTLREIGSKIGGVHHTTVLNSKKVILNLMATDLKLKGKVERIKKRLK